ncbi:hypothetical protein OLX02_01445 [Novosphingobium sp. KCTC 2891]|uniref:tetratricopeptide repeat protein n=1 Tax=Novosphingobium sp. KCTC 2891 TaxID=2989730 RepID=UPI0022212E4C|nr:hypothetical protein [Novosphingobium sp. KCTC 2891]MCW1381478.1 hypothetical protein [Novosphingobium sp. KCTC 2891]
MTRDAQRSVRVRWPWLLLLAVLVVAATGYGVQRWRHRQGPPDPVPAEIHPWFGPKTAAEAITAANVQIDGARERIARGQKDWLHLEILGDTLVGRYRLTGNWDDLAEADRTLDEAIALADFPAGPSLSRAALSNTLHRLDDVEKALTRFDAQKARPLPDEASSAWALRGDGAMQRGDYASAREDYGRAEAAANNAGLALRQSMLALRTGDPELARRRVNAVLRGKRLTRQALASAALQRATVAYAVGDWAAAGRWVRYADGVFPGQWLAQAFAAQQEAVEGRPDVAATRYAALAEHTQAPEVMDALAHLLRLQGKRDESRQWAARAGAIWARRVQVLPEAAAAHAAEHELAVGDPARALVLARADAARRPHGATLALLARAQLLTGDAAGALATIDKAERGGWRSALLLLQKAEALDALGRGGAAEAARTAALKINPKAADPAARFVWFGHD